VNSLLERASAAAQATSTVELRGNVRDVTGLIIEGSGPLIPVGSHVTVHSGALKIAAQVVGFRTDRVLLMPYGEPQGISPGALITSDGAQANVLVSDRLLGRVINAMGEPLDGMPLAFGGQAVPLYRTPPNPILRTRIQECFDTGVRAINSMLTVGVGQRVGIMAGSGVGKSTLLGMIAKHSSSDINVIALVGERGREVREFIERDLGPDGMKRSIVVVATGNESALLRIRAALLATAIAEHYRDCGKKVVLMVDSVTRFCMAQREIGLAVGEPPSTRGYTPSVFSVLPKLLERAGNGEGQGSITGLYTVLVDGDDMNEPIADATRGILDGHIVLSRKLASKGHFPAIEILDSISRVMSDITPPEVQEAARQAREIIATYRETEDLISIGAYKAGMNPKIDRSVQLIDALNKHLKQIPSEKSELITSLKALNQLILRDKA